MSNKSFWGSRRLLLLDTKKAPSTVASHSNHENNLFKNVPEESATEPIGITASTVHSNSKLATCKVMKAQLEGELWKLSTKVTEVREAADALASKMDQKEKRVDRWKDEAHTAWNERNDAIAKVKSLEREREREKERERERERDALANELNHF